MAVYPRLDRVQRPGLVTNPGPRRRGKNPQVSFDPFDYATPAEAKRARDALYRQLRAAGHRPRRSVLRGQLEKYRGLGVGGRGVRDVYYVTWEDPTLPSEARVFGHRQNPWEAWHEARRYQYARLARAARKGSRRRAELRAMAAAHAESARASRALGVRPPANPRPSRAAFCPEQVAPKSRFDPRSFRTVVSDGHRVTVGCPKGKWDPRRKRCQVGTRAQRILHPEGEGVCPLPGLKVRRRRRNNPPAGPVEIYRRVEFIGATKGPGDRYAGERFLHRFRTPARMLGLPDGSLLIQAGRGR